MTVSDQLISLMAVKQIYIVAGTVVGWMSGRAFSFLQWHSSNLEGIKRPL